MQTCYGKDGLLEIGDVEVRRKWVSSERASTKWASGVCKYFYSSLGSPIVGTNKL